MINRLLQPDRAHPFSLERRHRNVADRPDLDSGVWAIFKRMSSYDENHGAEYLALLQLRAEAVWVFWNLWARRRSAPHAILLKDHGFGGNWASFGGRDAPLYKLASAKNSWPRWLVVNLNTPVWPGYRKVAGAPTELTRLYLRRAAVHR